MKVDKRFRITFRWDEKEEHLRNRSRPLKERELGEPEVFADFSPETG